MTDTVVALGQSHDMSALSDILVACGALFVTGLVMFLVSRKPEIKDRS